MATGKRFYWMKLKESFMTSDTIDFFMSQPDGANYVILYQMLCLKTINTGGRFCRQIGEVLIPYDVEKITRDCKWFSADTVRVALDLYKAFGLIYEDVDGIMVMANHADLVGSETDWAAKKQRQRLQCGENVPAAVPAHVPEGVPIDIRDKSIEIRDRDKSEIEDKTLVEERGSGEDSPAPPPPAAVPVKPSKSPKKMQDAFAIFAGKNESLLAALRGYEEMRKSIKKPLTDRAKQMAVNKLNELAPNDPATQAAILDQSVYHSWQGLFALKSESDYTAQRERQQAHNTGQKGQWSFNDF